MNLSSALESNVPSNQRQHSILVVDDSPFVLGLFSWHLLNEGFRMIPARDGNEALAALDKQMVDLVILDVQMPGMNGLEVLATLRRKHSSAELPIIMATALADSEDMVKAFDLGADDYVTKPLDFPVVLARIQSRLRIHRLGPQAREEQVAALAEIEPGIVLEGKYRLESRIGQGKFGMVYRATHQKLRRPVAVKVLRTDLEDDGNPKERFHREGMSACRIQHPNAVSVLDFSVTSSGVPYMVMELLEGRSLEQELAREGRLSPVRCAHILLPICEVLTEAHNLGIIHRDVKPPNIFLHQGPRGEVVKVLDFGVAKLVGDAALAKKITEDGVGPGTPYYMAPERFSELPYDGGADVYSLGVMLYEMLTGQLPFTITGCNTLKLAMMHLCQRPRPLRELVPELPAEIDALVLEALAKDPDERPPAQELGERFAAALSNVPGLTPWANLSRPPGSRAS